ncbi:hypothetical protein PtrSN002B_001377 [Pyrenophora tritici-repentis]|nr:hypothetical protein A1F94_001669 [Pyrenophora tritici-repentis]KAI1545257.1 hypothetical protein PtrSN001A_002434 [Pyrenophora tritici-repentis]KAI1551266.1 hypothetical protein PtrSN001C_001200 [Pyrenophora tritici-repentis]KAI1557363.1 hypothetical protein PtrSN002B_001377 [Pyrenophora tritici-repentis]KAI1576862.1 hypothetical protein PtrEW4_001949 [Pyrenophora tritici-repentis]
MAELLSLPDELLLAIANEMQGDIRNAYRSLRSLALSCRRLRPIAQEVLYMDVAICRTQSLRGPNSLTCLVQTLVQRPGLAVKVNKLNLRIIGNPIMHSKDCLELMYTEYEGCTCGFKPVLSLCIETIGNIRANNGSRLYNHDWASNIQAGLQLAMVGLILCLTPHLESLTLDYRKQKMESSGFYTKPIAFEHFSLDDLFGSVTQSPAFSIEHIKGFAKLTRLITNTCPPSKLISLPQLKGLEIGLLNDHWNQDRGLRPLLSTGTALSMTMTHLTVRLDKLALYSDRAILVRGVYRRLNDIIKNLTVLEYLFLQFGSEWGKRFDPRQGDLSEASFEYVTSEIESLSLTHLALDVEDVGKAWFYESGETPFEVIRPMTSLRRLPKLRSITAPEEAFFFPGGFETCVIPSTIENIS